MEETNPTGEVTEAQTEVVETPAASEVQPASWDNVFDSAFESKSEEEVKPEGDATETEVSPEAPFPPDAETKPEEEQTEEPEEEPELSDVTSEENRISPLSRKKRDEVVKAVIDPLRNPDIPITEARQALRQFHPTRAVELEQQIVNDSIQAYPNDWMQVLTGVEGLTVERVKEVLSIVENLPQTEQVDDTKDIPDYLTELYGEDWKNPANDTQLLDEDAKLAKLYRRTLELDERYQNGEQQLKSQLETNNKELEELRKVADEIKQKQEQESQQAVENTFNQFVTEYRSEVEQRAVPKVLGDVGLTPTSEDTETVKGVKESIKSFFEPQYGISDFELYVQNEFQSRKNVEDISRRVAANLSQAAQLKAQGKQAEADSLMARAKEEQNALVVLTKRAAQDFLKTPRVKRQLDLLEENANLRRQLSTGRVEIIGSAVAGNEGQWLEDAKQQGDVWGAVGNRLSSVAR